jgi:putative component of toxin-antitoxin plasmid stabilization module
MLELREYVDELGRSRYAQWIDALDDNTTARILRSVTRLMHGNLSAIKSVGSGVSVSA